MNVTHSLGLVLLQVLLACGCKGQPIAQAPGSQRSGWELSQPRYNRERLLMKYQHFSPKKGSVTLKHLLTRGTMPHFG
ncbi:hypothetical protein [Hyalangium sp.]|uniref:hypothetical protein n=1 Tax=Hyalangium sp. TaxID=2028555 RepID=UPI002D4CCB72|nr:hypothetical protein [Hyalangium sp.]HYH96118.1 hypothetical protein [Hyalangium sp.]